MREERKKAESEKQRAEESTRMDRKEADDMEEKIQKLQEIADTCSNIVFFGGAGVSTESGIPDFRSVDGLYHMKYDYPPETILSHTFFKKNTKEFYRFYKEKMLILDVEPNTAHKKLAEMEQKGRLKAIVTQNIDGLHQKAGSKTVLELHGSIHRNYCQRCMAFYDAEAMLQMEDVPHCTCGGIVKPDVVLYEEGLDQKTIQEAIYHIANADALIIGGTSLAVYPAAGLIDYFKGEHLIVINKSPTPRDRQADLLIPESIGTVLGALEIKSV